MSKKELLSKVLDNIAILPGISCISNIFKKRVVILAYHRVMNIKDNQDYNYDIELVSASTSDFEKQVQYIKKNYTPITFSMLKKLSVEKKLINKPPIIITFDDGFLDNYDYVYPILKKYSVPATFFISTSYIGGNETFWFDWVAYIINTAPGNKYSLLEGKHSLNLGEGKQNRHIILAEVLKLLKSFSNADRLKFINELGILTGILKPNTSDLEKSKVMSWDQVIEMSENGMEIGSHTKTHPILTKLSNEEKREEIVGSKNIIEEKTGKSCIVISYPVGGKDAYDEKIIKYVKGAGYEFGASYIPGGNKIKNILSNKYSLRRIHVERYNSFSLFKTQLIFPDIFG